jgi:hypothetical protein
MNIRIKRRKIKYRKNRVKYSKKDILSNKVLLTDEEELCIDYIKDNIISILYYNIILFLVLIATGIKYFILIITSPNLLFYIISIYITFYNYYFL